MKKTTKDITIGPECLAPEERSRLREADLERQLAAQRVELLKSEHARAVPEAQQMEARFQAIWQEIARVHGISIEDSIDAATGAITRKAPVQAVARKQGKGEATPLASVPPGSNGAVTPSTDQDAQA